ncbi:MAG: hypothetical protein D6731_15495 [Planctomycetota bacterium]|nr:MAG: hypothetical protein D6731_15495 [Planctomycetota bacterium]
MSRLLRATRIAAFLWLGLAGNSWAQARSGIYQVTGTEPGRGRFRGRVELRWQGGDYSFVREVEYQGFRYRGHPVSLVWSGRAQDLPAGVRVRLKLERMGWASGGPGLPSRSARDGTPMPVNGTFVTRSGGLGGAYAGQGPVFVGPSERWVRVASPGPTPIWEERRAALPSHDPPGNFLRRLLFRVFSSFHATPWVRPYVGRPEFQAAIHRFVYERTDYALLRSRPDLLRLVNRVVDPLNLEEALVKTNAFGKTLRKKADEADREIPLRFRDPAGPLVQRSASGAPKALNDGALWTGAYAYSQHLRYRITGAPVARDNLDRAVRALLVMMEITGRGDAFARTIRASSGQPPGTRWVAGTGPYAGIEWRKGGNNDMFKGLLWGGLVVHEAYPAGDPLRAKYGNALARLIRSHPVVRRRRLPSNELMANGLVSLLLASSSHRRRYRTLARNPFFNLYQLAIGGGFHFQGISDWSGIQLEVVALIVQIRLAAHHRDGLVSLVDRLALRRAAKRLARTRPTLHLLAAAALGVPGRARIDTSEAVWALREVPVPRARLAEHTALREDHSLSPYPSLPWKLDWTQDPGRAYSIVAPPLFERELGTFCWKNNPFLGVGGRSLSNEEDSSADYLFAYWLARAGGAIGPND